MLPTRPGRRGHIFLVGAHDAWRCLFGTEVMVLLSQCGERPSVRVGPRVHVRRQCRRGGCWTHFCHQCRGVSADGFCMNYLLSMASLVATNNQDQITGTSRILPHTTVRSTHVYKVKTQKLYIVFDLFIEIPTCFW